MLGISKAMLRERGVSRIAVFLASCLANVICLYVPVCNQGHATATAFAKLQSPQILPSCNRQTFCRVAVATPFAEL
jgi:hypothetical protein